MQAQYGLPTEKKHIYINKIEQVQKRATNYKQIPEMKNLNYEERLRKLKLPTLGYRRVRGDMIEMYKIIKGKYDKDVITLVKTAEESEVRHTYVVLDNSTTESKYRNNKEFFCIRVAKVWNRLPEKIIMTPSINSFKNRLDKGTTI
jgi:hypothetical protein